MSAWSVALATFVALWVPRDLLTASFTPRHSNTARTVLLAMIPVPGGAGRSNTLAPQKSPQASCGIVPAFNVTSTIRDAADFWAFAMASATSPDLPKPRPTRPQASPTTIRALKVNRRPPLTALAQRLMKTTRVFGSGFLELFFEVSALKESINKQ